MTGLPLWDKVCMNLTQKHVVLPKKFGHITPLPAHNGHLSTTPLSSVFKMAVVERFDCTMSRRLWLLGKEFCRLNRPHNLSVEPFVL